LFVLKDAGLKQFLGGVVDLDKHPARFDFTTMNCPFDLRLQLTQPYVPNEVEEIGSSDANRRELIEWLSTLALQLPKKIEPQVIGDSMTLSIPCGTLDLY
jgi:hypothetical protein